VASNQLRLDRKAFLRQYSLTAADFQKTTLDWQVLEHICALHTNDIPQLETTADYVSQRLRRVPAVHSLKVRIKHPEHLIEKIIRKKLGDPTFAIDAQNYKDIVTDLIGIRAMHLFKGDWRPIHEFVTETWELAEKPIAYVREGDSSAVLAAFGECGCTVEAHHFGYRSVHYLLRSQPAKPVHLAELQVRTLFEEGWSEIDHQVRYPRLTDNPHLAEFLTIFNRLAGSADEMGTFIKTLSRYLSEQSAKLKETETSLAAKEKELKQAISDLNISEAEKRKLEAQVDALRSSSRPFTPLPFPSGTAINLSSINVTANPIVVSGSTVWSPGIVVGGLNERTCGKCSRQFKDDALFTVNDKCPQCRNPWLIRG
jgi:ppGpp synthetase/RelA/SpoT-type nucleotidyltranferase